MLMGEAPNSIDVQKKRGLPDSGGYFRYMADFVGLDSQDIQAIRQTKPAIEKHLVKIVGEFYDHLLRYPPTRKFFLKKDGSLDVEYVELRMRHLSNFWVRTADAVFDDDYARYIDYIGRAHTSQGADPHIYIAERYVIGQVGFMQRAIHQVLVEEFNGQDEMLEHQALAAWDKLMMVLLEMMSRAYSSEREEEGFDPIVPVDQMMVSRLATHAYEHEFCQDDTTQTRPEPVAQEQEIPVGERKIIKVGNLSIGVFHTEEGWFAIRNSCLHRGGPIATGELEDGVLVCPWHGYEYRLETGELLADSSARVVVYPVVVKNGEVSIMVPDESDGEHSHEFAEVSQAQESLRDLAANEFLVDELAPGQMKLVFLGEDSVAVYQVGDKFFATQSLCTHMGGELTEGDLEGDVIRCPIHWARFRVVDGSSLSGPARKPLKTFRVVVDGKIGRVEA
jgi:ethylbenzene dioxygenase ferredoxin subunit